MSSKPVEWIKDLVKYLFFWEIEDKVKSHIPDEKILAEFQERGYSYQTDTYIVLTDEAIYYWKPKLKNTLGIGSKVKRLENNEINRLDVAEPSHSILSYVNMFYCHAPRIKANLDKKSVKLGLIVSDSRERAKEFTDIFNQKFGSQEIY
jgi:hypothetical protein